MADKGKNIAKPAGMVTVDPPGSIPEGYCEVHGPEGRAFLVPQFMLNDAELRHKIFTKQQNFGVHYDNTKVFSFPLGTLTAYELYWQPRLNNLSSGKIAGVVRAPPVPVCLPQLHQQIFVI